MSYNQDFRAGNPPYSQNNPDIQTIPNSGFNQGVKGTSGQTNTDTAYSSTAYDTTQQSGLGSGGTQGYSQNTSYDSPGMNTGGDYNTTQASGRPASGGWDTSRQPQQQYAPESNQSSGYSGDMYDSSQQYQSTARKVSTGDKIKGTFEKLSGKVTGNPEKVMHGEDLASGRTLQ